MARLAAKEKALFYPTPLEIVATIASNIVSSDGGTICDPCCGTGEPLALLGDKLGLITYGNELHPERFAQAKTRLDHCQNGAREFLEVEGKFDVLFDNPPMIRP
jgi:type I restriction-modification system DNA methylase subunit